MYQNMTMTSNHRIHELKEHLKISYGQLNSTALQLKESLESQAQWKEDALKNAAEVARLTVEMKEQKEKYESQIEELTK